MENEVKSETSDLEILQNQGKTVIVGKETIQVKPFTFGQLLKALKYLANIGKSFGDDNLDDSQIMQIIAYNTEDVASLLCLATGKPREFFDTISAEEGIELTLAAWEVNKDFFANRLAPKLQELTKQNTPSSEEAGLTQSKPSSSTDTEETK